MTSRLQYYNWELATLGNLPENTLTVTNLHNNETQCNDNGKGVGNNPNCRMLNGEPFVTADYVDDTDEHKRRELFVTAVECIANDVKSNSVLNIAEIDGRWLKFFMTEHVDHPGGGGLEIYAEFIEEVTDRDDEHFRLMVQLYE